MQTLCTSHFRVKKHDFKRHLNKPVPVTKPTQKKIQFNKQITQIKWPHNSWRCPENNTWPHDGKTQVEYISLLYNSPALNKPTQMTIHRLHPRSSHNSISSLRPYRMSVQYCKQKPLYKCSMWSDNNMVALSYPVVSHCTQLTYHHTTTKLISCLIGVQTMNATKWDSYSKTKNARGPRIS